MESWVNSLDIPTSQADASSDASASAAKIKLSFVENEAVVTLEDNTTTRDFLSMLPVTLTFQDYAGSEKISYLPHSLSTDGAPSTYDPDAGDLILYPTGDFNGPGQKQNCGYWILRASAGSWRGFGSNRKRLSVKGNRGIYSDKNVPKIAYISVL